jgi:hypothetical protein
MVRIVVIPGHESSPTLLIRVAITPVLALSLTTLWLYHGPHVRYRGQQPRFFVL